MLLFSPAKSCPADLPKSTISAPTCQGALMSQAQARADALAPVENGL